MSSNKQVEKNKKRKSEDKLCERGIQSIYNLIYNAVYPS